MTLDMLEFLRDLSRFTRRLLVSSDVDETLDDLALSLSRNLGLAGSAVNLATDGSLSNASAVPSRIRDLEETQLSTQSGPCVEAFRSGEVNAVADLRLAEGEWLHYRQLAEKHGIHAVVGIPMRLADQAIGVVNLYSDHPRNWSEKDLLAASVMVDLATSHLINASQIEKQQRLAGQLQQALDSRVVIEQAKGIIASSREVTVEQAFALIQRHARSHHTSIRTVAEAVVNLGLRL
jgi:GAF domain-containing protein